VTFVSISDCTFLIPKDRKISSSLVKALVSLSPLAEIFIHKCMRRIVAVMLLANQITSGARSHCSNLMSFLLAVKGKVVPVLKKAYWGSGGIAPLII
jgi:predicted ABC-type exoprotein transport system permease subunit